MSSSDKDGFSFLYPMMPIYPSLMMLRTKILHFKIQLSKENKLTVYGVIAVKINLSRKFPLRKEHWNNPQNELFKKDYRLIKYRDMMADMPQLYSVLVLPNAYDVKNKKWSFINWIPLLITTDNKKIDDLIKISDQPVDNSAKHMGIYSIEYAKGFNLKTGKIIEPNDSHPLKVSDC